MICSYYRRFSKLKVCTAHGFNYTKFENTILSYLRNLFKKIDEGKIELNMKNSKSIVDYSVLQDKIKKGECSIWAINHAMRRNAPPEEIALIAVKGLALVTSDAMIFKTVADAWRERYGMTIEENPPYKISYCKKEK